MKSIIDTLAVIKNAVTRFNEIEKDKASVALIGGHALSSLELKEQPLMLIYAFIHLMRSTALYFTTS